MPLGLLHIHGMGFKGSFLKGVGALCALYIIFSPQPTLGATYPNRLRNYLQNPNHPPMSAEKTAAWTQWLDEEPEVLIHILPGLRRWTPARIKRAHDELLSEGFIDPRWAVQENPRLLTMNHGGRMEAIAFLTKLWNLRQPTVFDHPILVGHYVPMAFDYFQSLSQANQKYLRSEMSETGRAAILMVIRAKSFHLPRFRIDEAYRLADRSGCAAWVEEIYRAR